MSTRPFGFGLRETAPGSVISKKQQEEHTEKLRQIIQALPLEQRQFYEENPHLQQTVACPYPRQGAPEQKALFTQTDRILNLETAPRAPYEQRKDKIKTMVHVGQRKLLVTEIEFLTRFTMPDKFTYVVYAGAAGGRHHEILDRMFPTVQFLLYDPHRFVVKTGRNRQVYQEFFTTSTAQELASKFRREDARCLFISDVRRFEENITYLQRQQLVLEDLENQKIWLQILNPAASLLKFVMPYPVPGIPMNVEYLDGIIFLQPWSGPTSSETRLLVTNNRSSKQYDIVQYEEVMFYHNTVIRATYYQDVEGVPSERVGCHCYDCASELFVLGEYVRKYSDDPINMQKQIKNILAQLNRQLG